MPAPRTLRRLLRVLELEEEQAQGALETALGELRLLLAGRAAALERERRGRRLVGASAASGELTERLAGIEEARAGRRLVEVLKERIAATEREASARREAFLAKRVERRQAETLAREAEAREARETERRTRQSLDEWYLHRKLGAKRADRHRADAQEKPVGDVADDLSASSS